MLDREQLQKLHTNQRLFIIEMQKRGIDVNAISCEMELIEAKYKDHKELILDRDSSIVPYTTSIICGDKYLTKKLLVRSKIKAVEGEQFFYDEIEQAQEFAKKIGYPVVVKPVFGSHGDGVYMDINSSQEVKDAIEKIINNVGKSRGYLVEKQFEGKEYRVFVTKNNDFAVLNRDPAHVIGDGINSIEKLVEQENYIRMHPRRGALCEIVLDNIAKRYLNKCGLDVDYIPNAGEKVYVRHNSNVATGGICEDYTDIVHPSVIEICKRVLKAFGGLPYAGIDFLSKDITEKQDEDMYRIVEVNTVPGVHMHMNPGLGKPRNVAKYMVDMIFPETRRDEDEQF